MTDPSVQPHFLELHQQLIHLSVKSETLKIDDLVMSRIFRGKNEWKVELTSQINVSFVYIALLKSHQIVKEIEHEGQEEQWLADIFSGQHCYQLQVNSPQYATLKVTSLQKYKYYELFSLQFSLAPQDFIRKSIMYRYSRMYERQKMLDSYWQNITQIIRTKNPSLLLQFQNKHKKQIFK